MSAAHAADPADAAMAARWKLWGAAYGGVAAIQGDATTGAADLTARNWGIASGFDRSFGDGHLGLSLGGAGSTFTLAGGLGSGSVGIFNAGLYGGRNFGNAYVSGALAYGWNNARTTRVVGADTLNANFNAHTLSGRLEAGYRWGTTSAITPYAGMQGGTYFLPAFAEASALGGPFALAYASQSESMLRTELGARFEHSMPMRNGTLKFSGRAAWGWNAVNGRVITTAFQALPGQAFAINGARPDRHSALIDLGIEAAFASGLSAKLSFSGEFSGNLAAYGAAARLSYRW
jgi:outer membrane autotransporter protein